MKIPGSDVHIVLPPWPENCDIMAMLHEGVWIKSDKKGGFFIKVGPPVVGP